MKLNFNKINLLLLSYILVSITSLAQKSKPNMRIRPVNPWFIGLGTNIVQDNGSPFFNIPPFPSRLSGGKQMNQYITLEGSLTYNRYTTRVKAENAVSGANVTLFSFDIQGQFDVPQFNTLTQNKFNPYLTAGLGFSSKSGLPVSQFTTTNIGIGFYSWFTKRWGLQVQSCAKFGNTMPFLTNSGNYMQHSLGVVYQFIPYDRNSNFGKRKHPEVRKKRRYKAKTA